jgi:hypothetical protein
VAAAAIAVWIFFGNTILATYERRAMSLMNNDLPIGLSRAQAYKRIKAHGMVAFNFNYLREVENPPGSFTTIEHSDEWPQPGQAVHFRVIRHPKFVEMVGPVEAPFDIQHPFVRIEFTFGQPSYFLYQQDLSEDSL